MTEIYIKEDFLKLEIQKWNDLTEKLFKDYAEWRVQLNKDKAKFVPEEKVEKDTNDTD